MTTPNRAPDVLTSLTAIFHALLSEAHFALPAAIVKFNPPLADVKPTLKRVFLDENEQEVEAEYPVITNVPVAFPRGGGGFLTFPLKEGDLVLLVFAQRSLDTWLETDGKTPIDPGDARRHHISDAVAFAGLTTTRNAIPNIHAENVVLGLEDGSAEIHLTPDGEIKLGSDGASHPVALGDGVQARLSAVESWITMAHAASVLAAGNLPNAPLPDFTADTSDVTSGKVFTDA